jgi:hypothetical protein
MQNITAGCLNLSYINIREYYDEPRHLVKFWSRTSKFYTIKSEITCFLKLNSGHGLPTCHCKDLTCNIMEAAKWTIYTADTLHSNFHLCSITVDTLHSKDCVSHSASIWRMGSMELFFSIFFELNILNFQKILKKNSLI